MKNEFDQRLDSALDTLEHLRNVCSGPLWERLSRDLGEELSSEDILAVVQNYILLNEQRCVIPKALSPDNFRFLVIKMLEARDHDDIPSDVLEEAVDRILSSNDDRVKALFSNVSRQDLIAIFEEESGWTKTERHPDVDKALKKASQRSGGQGKAARAAGISPEHASNVAHNRKGLSIDSAQGLGITDIRSLPTDHKPKSKSKK